MSDPTCPICNSEMIQHDGKFGSFWGCTDYPDCKGSVNIADPDSPDCPTCGEGMRRRAGVRGPFWGCISYPECRGLINIDEEAVDTLPTLEKRKKQKKAEISVESVKKIAKYWHDKFFDERQWWVRMVGEKFPMFSEDMPEVKLKNTHCHTCGHKLEAHCKGDGPFQETGEDKREPRIPKQDRDMRLAMNEIGEDDIPF